MTVHSAAEFIALHHSVDQDDYDRASHEDAPMEVWLELIEHHAEMRFWVAQNKTVPMEVLRLLASDPDWRVRHMVAMKNKADADILDRLAGDEDESIRMRVARHRNASSETLRRLLDDPWDQVREKAAERLRERAE